MAFCPEHPKWDQNPKFIPLSETTSIHTHFIRGVPPARGSLTIYILWFRSGHTQVCQGGKMQKKILKKLTIQGATENSLVLFLVGNFDKCHCMEASFEREGCYGDQENHRLLRYHILNEAQKRMTNFWLPFLAWFWKQSPAWFYLPLCRWGEEARIWRLWYKELRYVQWRIQGRGPGDQTPPSYF